MEEAYNLLKNHVKIPKEKALDLGQPIDLGRGNIVFLTDKDLDRKLLNMEYAESLNGRFFVNSTDALSPASKALDKILSNAISSLTPNEIKGLLITIAALFRAEHDELITHPQGSFLRENQNVLYDTQVGVLKGSGENPQTVSIKYLKEAYEKLKENSKSCF